MNSTNLIHRTVRALLAAALTALPGLAAAQSTAFTYQGDLHQAGAPATGNFDMDFTLKDALAGGNTVGTPVSLTAVPVADGVFTVSLDFGADAFSGGDRWLETTVNGSTLTPRQPLTPTPLALGLPNVYTNPANGRVGIGTDNPAGLLHLQQDTGFALRMTHNGVGTWDIRPSTFGTTKMFRIYDPEVGEDRLVIRDDGKVGIGTISPESPLHVEKADGGVTAIFETGTGGNGVNSIEFRSNKGGANFGTDLLFYDEGNQDARISSAANGGLWFGTSGRSSDMIISSNGNVGIGDTSPEEKLTVAGNVQCTTAIITSDRNQKDGFAPVDAREVLDKVAAMPVTRWHYKSDTGVPHIGPVAQDFHAAFGLGTDDKHIATVDADGVALAAIKGLNELVEEQLQEKNAEIEALKAQVSAMEARFSTLEARLTAGE